MPLLSGINYERRGSGSPLLLVHGIGSRWQVWRPVLDTLAAEHDVIAVDLPGFGESPRPGRGTPAGVLSLCARLEAFLDELEIARPHVAGNSLGGWIALELARRGSVASATGVDPGGFLRVIDNFWTVPTLSLSRLSSHALRRAPRLLASPTGRRLAFSQLVAHPERMTPEDAALGLEGLASATWFWATLADITRNVYGDGAGITVPVTIAWGDKDRLLFPRLAATALAKIPSAAFVSLPDCGHLPMYDNPELVAEVILRTASATGDSAASPAA